MPNAIAVIAWPSAARCSSRAPRVYMDKIAVGPEAADAIDIEAPAAENLRSVAKAKRHGRARPDASSCSTGRATRS